MSDIDPVALLTWARDHPGARSAIYAALDLDENAYDPIDVPLHAFEFRRATLSVQREPGDPLSVEQTVELFAVKAPDAAVGRDGEGNLFLIRAGDWLLRSATTGDYGILKVGE